MKNKVVRKLLMVGLSSSVVLTSTVGVTAASMDTVVEARAENTAEDEVLTPVEGEEAVTEETGEEVAEEETTEETVEEETTEETEETDVVLENCTVIFEDENGTQIGSGSVTPYDYANGYYICRYSDVEGIPEGKEIAGGTGDFSVSKNQRWTTLTLTDKAETPASKNITILFVDEATNEEVGHSSVDSYDFANDYYMFRYQDIASIPETHELVNPLGDGSIHKDAVAATVLVKKKAEKPTTKNITVLYTCNGEEVGHTGVDATLVNGYWVFNTKDLPSMPDGYEVVNAGDVNIPEKEGVAVVELRKVAETRTVYVSFIDEETKQPLENGIQEIEIGAKDTVFNTSKLTAPDGYEICNVGDVYIGENDTVNVEVRKVATTRPVYVSFIDEETKQPLKNGIQEIEIGAEDTYFSTNLLSVPEGYELCQAGDVYVGKGDTVNVEVRAKGAETRKIYVSLVTESGDVISPNQEIEIAAGATTFHTKRLAVPKGYELCQVGDMYIGNGDTMNVFVREVQVATDKNVIVSYVDEENKNVGTQDLLVGIDDTYVNTSKLNVPYGYELVNVGDLAFNADNTLTVEVRAKEYTRDVTVNYVDEAGNPVLTTTIKLAENATYFNTNILTDVPYGWIIAVVGDIPVVDNTATVVVRQKQYTKDVVINYVDELGNNILTSGIKIAEDATYFNTSILKDVPYGWELAVVGDIQINEDNTANVVVREKAYTKDVVINYVDEEGNNILTSGIKVDKDATYFNTSILTDVPYGWEIAVVGDIQIKEDNTADVVVRQKEYTRDVTVKYVTEDGKEVGTGALVVDEKDTYINTSILIDIPEGYVIAIVGDLPIEDNTVVVTVRAEKEDPDQPVDPENPTPTPDPEDPTPTPDPDQPVDPENPTPTPDQNKPTVAPEKPDNNNQNTTDTNKSEVKTDNPKTGDATNTVPLVAGLLGSGSMIGLIQMLRRKKK